MVELENYARICREVEDEREGVGEVELRLCLVCLRPLAAVCQTMVYFSFGPHPRQQMYKVHACASLHNANVRAMDMSVHPTCTCASLRWKSER